MATHYTSAHTSPSTRFHAAPRKAARAIAIPARGRQRGLQKLRDRREDLLLAVVALLAGSAIFSFALRVSEDFVLSLMAPIFTYLLVASLIAAGTTRGR
ncbi:MAG: hypothetical protein KGJ57_07810 [Sphingomonadales bacterium]|nr:hypothetical protein [Sphingomonadales bacterium]MDE2169318.1 hypothetical protein [Sphingomonadales bacterium]